MPSPQIIKIEKTLKSYSIEDKQWLLQQLMKQLEVNYLENPPVNYKQQAQEIMTETINEVLALSNDCEDELWQKYDLAKTKISQKLNESDLL